MTRSASRRSYGLMAFCLFLLSATPGAAQEMGAKPMIGFRQGAGLWLTKTGAGQSSLRLPPGQHFTWNKELFGRMHVYRNWYAEGGIQHYQFRNTIQAAPGINAAERIQYLQLSLSAQSDVSYPLLGYLVPFFLKMRSYAGVTGSVRYAFIDKKTVQGERQQSTGSSLLIGFHYMHVLPVSKHIHIISAYGYQSKPLDRFRANTGDYSNPNRAFSWSTGIAYALD